MAIREALDQGKLVGNGSTLRLCRLLSPAYLKSVTTRESNAMMQGVLFKLLLRSAFLQCNLRISVGQRCSNSNLLIGVPLTLYNILNSRSRWKI